MVVKMNGHRMKGLFATRSYRPGDRVVRVEGEVVPKPTRWTVQVAPGVHVDAKAPLAFMNHHCRPNCQVVGYEVRALSPIRSGDELTFDYNASEEELAEPFRCSCCNRLIRGRLAGPVAGEAEGLAQAGRPASWDATQS